MGLIGHDISWNGDGDWNAIGGGAALKAGGAHNTMNQFA
jgi:hypothetical protein